MTTSLVVRPRVPIVLVDRPPSGTGERQAVPLETVERGPQGGPGLSAYEVAVENGYAGTVEQWLASLKGSAGGTSFHYAQPIPAVLWTIVHNLGRYPSVTLVDTAGDQVSADVAFIDANTIAVSFGFPTAGAAYLN